MKATFIITESWFNCVAAAFATIAISFCGGVYFSVATVFSFVSVVKFLLPVLLRRSKCK